MKTSTIFALLCSLLCAGVAFAQPRVLVVNGASLGGVRWGAWLPVKSIAAAALPGDPAALAAQADVLVVKPETLTPAQQLVVEAFVRGGGGLLLDGGGDRKRWEGGVLDVISPAIGRYAGKVTLAQPRLEGSSPLDGLDMTNFPRIGSVVSAATPDHTPTRCLNNLSAWYHTKPLWQDSWQEWLTAGDPANTPLLSTARYGAGHTAIMSVNNVADPAAPAYLEMLRRLLTWLGGDGKVTLAPLDTVAVVGYTLPDWYAKPLGDGLRGMGQKVGVDAFTLPPEALQEAGYQVIADPATAHAVILLGKEAENPLTTTASVVLRALSGTPAVDAPFDQAKLKVVKSVKAATLVEGEKSTAITLPHRMPAFADPLPDTGTATARPAITLPAAWKMAFTNDPDTEVDLKEQWYAPAYDDAKWRDGKIGAQKTTVFGKEMGYDGAIWYRGAIEVPQAAVIAGAALQLEARDTRGYITVYLDGKEMALEPRKVVLPLATMGAGKHLLAVRVYGELRTNTGLTALDTVALPLLWQADPKHEGWAKGWAAPDLDTDVWQAVNSEFSNDPAGKGPMEGWARMTVNVPDKAAPFTAILNLALNVESIVYVDGKRVADNGPARFTQYRLPGELFTPGRNVIAVWARYDDRQLRSFDLQIVPADPLVYRAVVTAERDGQGLRATLAYDAAPWWRNPAAVSMTINGQASGGSCGLSGARVVLFAPHGLKAGENAVEIRMTRDTTPYGLQALDVVDTPAGMAPILPGWKQCAREEVKGQWTDAKLDDHDWQPAPTTLVQQYEKSWVVSPEPDLARAGYLYRTHLMMSADDLQQIQTLYLRNAAVKEIFVNGARVAPDDEWYYTLNHDLHPGDNVIAFAAERDTYRGLNLPLPDGREGLAQMPVLRGDHAPLIPVDPRLAAYRLHRTFPVTALPAPALGATVLFAWPNGAPAVISEQKDQRWEARAAPGLFDNLLPAPNMAAHAMVNGSASSIEYDYAMHLREDGFSGDRTDQLLPAILGALEGKAAFTLADAGEGIIGFKVNTPATFKGSIAWRAYDWEGTLVQSGTSPILPNGLASIHFPNNGISRMHETSAGDSQLPEGTALGRHARVRAAIISEDGTTTFAFIDRHFLLRPQVEIVLHLSRKLDGLNSETALVARRVLHESNGQLTERFIYLPGEQVTVTAVVRNSTDKDTSVKLSMSAFPCLQGQVVNKEITFTLGAYSERSFALVLDKKLTTVEQPWTITALVIDGSLKQNIQRSYDAARCNLLIAKPRGEITEEAAVTHDDRQAGGYMWQMSPHAFPIEHRAGTDAQPVPDGKEWWTRVRAAGDGNWLVAEGLHRAEGNGDQHCLLWGPFYDQTRGEVMDSFGWFPNGENIRSWWGPYAVRDLLRSSGRRDVVLALADWWQYDAGFPTESFATLQMFNQFLVTNKGKTIAGKLLDGQPIHAATMGEMLSIIHRDYNDVYSYFQAAGLARSAEFSGALLNATAPGTTQSGQGGYSSLLPSVVGGITLGPQWAGAESQGILDADNHPFAGDWQYGIESMTFRAIGINNHLLTHWETPMDYHADRTLSWELCPLAANQWRRRLLDSRWLSIVDQQGKFQRVFNTTHEERFMDDLLPDATGDNIGEGKLPYQWWIKDRLAALSMTIAQAKPLSPLLVVGESRMDWGQYYGLLGQFRNAGLTLGGAVSIAQLDKLPADEIPALVWPVAEQVDGKLLAAMARKIAAGVPVLLIGNIPAAIGDGPDLRHLLGVGYTPDAPADATVTQVVAPMCADWPEARNIAQTPALHVGDLHYLAVPNGMDSLVTRSGRLALARSGKVVFYALTPRGLWDQDDPALRRMAVRALTDAMAAPITWPDGMAGYAFRAQDGNTYLVVENLRQQPHTGAIRLTGKFSGAADVLSGAKIPLATDKKGVEFTITLDGADGTLVMQAPAGEKIVGK